MTKRVKGPSAGCVSVVLTFANERHQNNLVRFYKKITNTLRERIFRLFMQCSSSTSVITAPCWYLHQVSQLAVLPLTLAGATGVSAK